MSRVVPEKAPDDLEAALRAELQRVENDVRPAYVECGAAAFYALGNMTLDLSRAREALGSGDPARMELSWRTLYGWDT